MLSSITIRISITITGVDFCESGCSIHVKYKYIRLPAIYTLNGRSRYYTKKLYTKNLHETSTQKLTTSLFNSEKRIGSTHPFYTSILHIHSTHPFYTSILHIHSTHPFYTSILHSRFQWRFIYYEIPLHLLYTTNLHPFTRFTLRETNTT